MTRACAATHPVGSVAWVPLIRLTHLARVCRAAGSFRGSDQEHEAAVCQHHIPRVMGKHWYEHVSKHGQLHHTAVEVDMDALSGTHTHTHTMTNSHVGQRRSNVPKRGNEHAPF